MWLLQLLRMAQWLQQSGSSLHNRRYFFLFVGRAKARIKRARSTRHAKQGKAQKKLSLSIHHCLCSSAPDTPLNEEPITTFEQCILTRKFKKVKLLMKQNSHVYFLYLKKVWSTNIIIHYLQNIRCLASEDSIFKTFLKTFKPSSRLESLRSGDCLVQW